MEPIHVKWQKVGQEKKLLFTAKNDLVNNENIGGGHHKFHSSVPSYLGHKFWYYSFYITDRRSFMTFFFQWNKINVICRSWRLRRITLTEVCIIFDIMRKPNPIIVLLYVQNSHTKMQAKCSSKKAHAINHAKCCYFVIFARFEAVTSSASNNGHIRPIIHSVRRNCRHRCRALRINWSMLANKEREWSLNV